MNFSRTDCVLSNLTGFISCGTSLTAILFFERVNNKCNVISTNVLKNKGNKHMKKDYYNIVKNIYMNNPKSFHMILKAKKNSELLDWINS